MKIAAGIVTYNPNLNLLKKNLSRYIEDVEKVYIFDNASENISEIKKELSRIDKIDIIHFDENRGIAYALNRLMEKAKNEGIMWMLTMDQDSLCDYGIIKSMVPYCQAEHGIVHPYVVEINGTRHHEIRKLENSYVDFCITSASLTNIKAWEIVGGYDEWMFIDVVDFEFCAKLRKHNYKILQLNNVNLYQQVGELREIIIGRRHIYVRNHSSQRKYYFIRNMVYCRYLHPEIFTLKIVLDLLVTIYLKTLLFEKNRIVKIAYMNRGFIDGIIKVKKMQREERKKTR